MKKIFLSILIFATVLLGQYVRPNTSRVPESTDVFMLTDQDGEQFKQSLNQVFTALLDATLDDVTLDELTLDSLYCDSASISWLQIRANLVPDATNGASIGAAALQFLGFYARHIDGDTVFVGVWGQNIDANQMNITDLNKINVDTANVTILGMGSASINETDITKIDAITNGTAAANKALVLSAALNIATIHNITANGTIATDTLTANIVDIDGGVITGITDLVVADGGTGVSTLADGGLLVGATTGAVEVVPIGLTTEILVGGGAATNPIWTTATGTGAPARAGSPVFTTQITTPQIVTADNAATEIINIPVTGTDNTAHTASLQIDGNTGLSIAATGNGAGAVGANTVNMGVSGNADVVHIGDANALVDITDAHWNITEAGVASIVSMGANWTNAGRTVADAGILTTVDINGGTIDGTIIGGSTAAAGTFTSATVGSTTTGGNVTVNATLETSIAPTLASANWTGTNGWSSNETQLIKVTNPAIGTITPSGTGATPTVAVTYKIVITASATSGAITYTYGGSAGTAITATTITDYVTAISTNKLIISGAISSTATITAISIQKLTDATGDVTVAGNLILGSPILNMKGTNVITIGSTGNVGIGTTNPGSKLSFGLSTANVAASKISVWENGGYFYSIGFANNGTTSGLGLYASDLATGNPKMIVLDNGNVGIGTMEPSHPFTVGDVSGLVVKGRDEASTTDSSLVISVVSGEPTITVNASDGDQWTIASNTADQMVITGAVGGIVPATGTPIILGTTQWDVAATDSINGAVIAAGTVPAMSLALLKDLVTTAPITGGVDNILPGTDGDVTIAITLTKDAVAGDGLGGGEDNCLPGADTDVMFAVLLDVAGGLETTDDSVNVKLNGSTLALAAAGLSIGTIGTSNLSDAAYIGMLNESETVTSKWIFSNIAGAVQVNDSAFVDTLHTQVFSLADNTSGKILVADGTSYKAVTMGTDASITSAGAVTVANDSHDHGTTTISGLDFGDDITNGAGIESIAGLTETNGGIPYGTADNAYAWLAAGAEGTLLMGNAAAAPSFLAAGTDGYMLVAAGAADPAWTAPTGTGAPVKAGSPTFTTQITTPKIVTSGNNGAANTGVTAVEYGDGYRHTTVLTINQANALTVGNNVALADGYLLYTFPAGAVVIEYAYMSISIDDVSEQLNDTPDVGLGTVIGTGAVAVLETPATFENIITGQTAANCNGTATVKTAIPTALVPFIIESGAAHTLHFNVADTWAAGDSGLEATIAGTVVIVWSFLK